MTENEKAESKGSGGLPNFVSRAMRRKMPGSYEQLLCQHLIKSVGAPPLEKIRLVAEAAFMVPDSPVDKETLDVLYKVVMSFNRTREDIVDPIQKWSFYIAWVFERDNEDFEKYILPWSPSLEGINMIEIRSQETMKQVKELEFGPTKFFFVTSQIHISGLAALEGRFISWAIPQIMTIFQKLSKLISPDLYETILAKMGG